MKAALLKILLLFCTFKNYQHLTYFYFLILLRPWWFFHLKHKISCLTIFWLWDKVQTNNSPVPWNGLFCMGPIQGAKKVSFTACSSGNLYLGLPMILFLWSLLHPLSSRYLISVINTKVSCAINFNQHIVYEFKAWDMLTTAYNNIKL